MREKCKWFIFILIAALSLVSLSCFFLETRKIRFETYEELIDSEFLAYGWIPSDFPENTFNIRGQYNIDTNKVWLTYEFSGSLQFSERTLSMLDDYDTIQLLKNYFRLRNKNVQFFTISDNEFLAVENQRSKAYYYRASY